MRIKHGRPVFGYKDSWDANSSLAPIIVSWLKNHKKVITEKKHLCGCPSKLLPNQVGQNSYEDVEQGIALWLEYLDKMIYAFENKEPEYDGGFIGSEHDFYKPSDQDAWDKYMSRLKTHNKDVQEGLDLFSQHFSDLWW